MIIDGKWAFDYGQLKDEDGSNAVSIKGRFPIDLVKEYGMRAVIYIKKCQSNSVSTERDYAAKMAAFKEALDWYEAQTSGKIDSQQTTANGEFPEASLRKAMQDAPSTRRDIEAWAQYFRELPPDLKHWLANAV